MLIDGNPSFFGSVIMTCTRLPIKIKHPCRYTDIDALESRSLILSISWVGKPPDFAMLRQNALAVKNIKTVAHHIYSTAVLQCNNDLSKDCLVSYGMYIIWRRVAFQETRT